MSYGKITIIIEENCEADGTGGTVTAKPIAIMPMATLQDIKEAAVLETRWQSMVDNPDFDETQEESDSNPRKTPNPDSKAWNIGTAIRKRFKTLIKNVQRQKNVVPLEQQVESGVESADSEVVVMDGATE